MSTRDILGRALRPGQWVAMPWRYSSRHGLRARQIALIGQSGIRPGRTAAFFRQTNGRYQEVTNDCVILEGYDGPEVN